MRLALLACLVLAGCYDWHQADTIRELGYAAESGADMLESVSITRGCHEENPVLGRCGESMSPYVYLPVTAALHAFISSVLPADYRRAWQDVTLGIEGGVVVGNALWLHDQK